MLRLCTSHDRDTTNLTYAIQVCMNQLLSKSFLFLYIKIKNDIMYGSAGGHGPHDIITIQTIGQPFNSRWSTFLRAVTNSGDTFLLYVELMPQPSGTMIGMTRSSIGSGWMLRAGCCPLFFSFTRSSTGICFQSVWCSVTSVIIKFETIFENVVGLT